MSLDDGDKAEIKEFAREIVKEVLILHTASCPYGSMLSRGKSWFIGICVGVGIGAGVGTGGIISMVLRFYGQS